MKDVNGYNAQYKRLVDWKLFFKCTNHTKIGLLYENLAFISPSGGAPLSIIMESYDLLLRFAPRLFGNKYRKYIKKLKAGMDFEFEIVCMKGGEYLRSLRYFHTSCIKSPFGHNSSKIIILPTIEKPVFKIEN